MAETMPSRNWIPATLIVALALLSGACAEPPEDHLKEAKAAFQAAQDAEALTYANDDLQATLTRLNDAELEIHTQNQRWAILRDYEEADKILDETIQMAEATRQAAIDAKEAARVEAENRLEKARAAVASADLALEEAPRGKGTKADILALTADLEGIRAEVTELENQIADEEYFAAHDKADSIVAAAEAITEEIEAAIEMEAKLLEKRRRGR